MAQIDGGRRDDRARGFEDARDAARGLAAGLREAAEELLDEQKARVAQMGEDFAAALRRSADAFRDGGSETVARCALRAADQVEDLSDAVKNRGWHDLLSTIEAAARRRPELVLAGAVVAGFVAGRVLTGDSERDVADS